LRRSAICIDPSLTFPNHAGRPVHILDDREPIRELLQQSNPALGFSRAGIANKGQVQKTLESDKGAPGQFFTVSASKDGTTIAV
jgi:hypothetical protein